MPASAMHGVHDFETGSSPSPHICMVVHSYYPVGEPRVEREAKAAVGRGYRVTVIALRDASEPAWETIGGVHVRRLNIRHVRGAGLGRIAQEYLRFLMAATLEVRRLTRTAPPSIVHIHAPPDFLVLAGLPARRRGAKLVLDIHDLSPDMFGARFGDRAGSGLVRRVLTLIEQAACWLADAAITVHEPYRQELLSRGTPGEKVTVVMNAPDPSVIAEAREKAGSNGSVSGFTLAYHGTITPWYGVDLLVESLGRLKEEMPHLNAVILGAGDALGAARQKAAEAGVSDRVSFSGAYVPIVDALAAVADANCGVIPNRPSQLNRFALSTKLFEYVELGIPVVVSHLETLAEHFNSDEVTFFEPGNLDSLDAAIRWVVNHPKEAQRKAAAAKARAEQYSWEANRVRYLGVLAALRPVPASRASPPV